MHLVEDICCQTLLQNVILGGTFQDFKYILINCCQGVLLQLFSRMTYI